MVVALIPSTGTDNAKYIHNLHMALRIMGGDIGMSILGGAEDGAASELAAQNLMDHNATELNLLYFENERYRVHVHANVYAKTVPFIPVQDARHGAKTGRNQPFHGTKASSLGTRFLSAQVLMSLQATGKSRLLHNELFNVDQQDNGAARRFYDGSMLDVATVINSNTGNHTLDQKCSGLFVYYYILGKSNV